jgi:cell shape-determining protein MreC
MGFNSAFKGLKDDFHNLENAHTEEEEKKKIKKKKRKTNERRSLIVLHLKLFDEDG